MHQKIKISLHSHIQHHVFTFATTGTAIGIANGTYTMCRHENQNAFSYRYSTLPRFNEKNFFCESREIERNGSHSAQSTIADLGKRNGRSIGPQSHCNDLAGNCPSQHIFINIMTDEDIE